MKRKQYSLMSLLVALALLLALVLSELLPTVAQSEQVPPAAPASVPERAQVGQALRSSPVMFIENVGQFADGARFQVRGGTGTMWLAEDAIWITVVERSQVDTLERFDVARANVKREDEPLRGVNLKLSFPGANPHPRIEPFDCLDTVVSYFIGNDPDQWHPDVPVWGGVRYLDLYPGVDLEVTSEGGRWTWQLAVRDSQFAISNVRLRVDGADALTLDSDRLRLTTTVGNFTLPLLTVEGATPNVQPITFNVERKAFEVTSPFSSAPSPPPLSSQDNPSDLLYSTYLGGGGEDHSHAIAVDGTGNAYVTGPTWSSYFPTTPGSFDRSLDGSCDAFVVKVNASGTGLAYATFMGGSAGDSGNGIAVDGEGSAYVTGTTSSSDFPATAGSFDTACGTDGNCNPHWFSGTDSDAFVVKLNASGTELDYGTFLGGSDSEHGYAIAVDGTGHAYVTGETRSSDFPTTVWSFDTACGTDGNCNPDTYGYPSPDVFVVKVNASGTDLSYAAFLGGSDGDCGEAIAVDGEGSAYVTGTTDSSDFPTTAGAFDTSYNGGSYYRDAFVVKVNSIGTTLAYATFLGGRSTDRGYAIALDGVGNAFATGETWSSNFPVTTGAFDTSYDGYGDAFVAKLAVGGGPPPTPDVRVSVSLGLSKTSAVAGEDVTASFTIHNYGNASFGAQRLGVAGRGPGGESDIQDFPFVQGPFVLPSDDDYTYTGTRSFSTLGDYHFEIVYQDDYGDWHDIPADPGVSREAVLQVVDDQGPSITDIEESNDPINIAECPEPNEVTISCRVTDASGVDWVNLVYWIDGGDTYEVSMTKGFIDTYRATIGPFDVAGTLNYYIRARDNVGNESNSSIYTVTVQDCPSQTYTISGRVTDGSGNPISGISISDGTGHTVTTDSNGNYTLSDLPVGTYTITPGRSGYTFSPVSRTVSMPPSATDQNFTGTPVSGGCPPGTGALVLNGLDENGDLGGVVTDGDTGQPISNVNIGVMGPDGTGLSAGTNPSGIYSVYGLPAGTYSIWAIHSPHAEYRGQTTVYANTCNLFDFQMQVEEALIWPVEEDKGKITALFDHQYPIRPEYETITTTLVPFWGEAVPNAWYYGNIPGASWYSGHEGVDIGLRGQGNVAIIATASGRVTAVQPVDGGGYGKYVEIEHDNGYSSLYGHLCSTDVVTGTTVPAGQTIGYIGYTNECPRGTTGNSTGPHLHFSVKRWGQYVDPFGWTSTTEFPQDPWVADRNGPESYPLFLFSPVVPIVQFVTSSSGATLTSSDGSVSVIIPPEAFASALTALSLSTMPDAWSDPSAPRGIPDSTGVAVGHPTSAAAGESDVVVQSFSLSARDSTGQPLSDDTRQPLSIQVHYLGMEGNIQESSLILYRWNSNLAQWDQLNSMVDPSVKIVSAQTTALGWFRLVGMRSCKLYLPLLLKNW